MTVFGRLHMPSLGGAAGWLNSAPLGPAELRGHVGLVDFSRDRSASSSGCSAMGPICVYGRRRNAP